MSAFEEITIALADGYRCYARYWPAERLRGSVLYLHGIQSHCGWYEMSARHLAGNGFAVLQPDRRGSGRNPEQRGHADSEQQLIQDGLICADELLRRSRTARCHVLGVSWGGKQAAAMHITAPEKAQSLTLVAPGIFATIDVPALTKLQIGMAMLSAPTRLFDIPLNDPELFCDNPEKLDFLRRDALQLHQATASFFLASRRMDRTARKLGNAPPIPVNVMLARGDRIIDNAKTRAFVRELKWPVRRITEYHEACHTLEFSKDPGQYFDDLVEWLSESNQATATTGSAPRGE